MNETNLIMLLLGAFFPSALFAITYQDKKKIAQALGHAASIRDHETGFRSRTCRRYAKGYKIPLNARIFAMIDVFDALLASRPYKEALSYEKAIAIMKENNGTHFDPKLFEIFLTFAPDFANMIATQTTAQLGEKLKERRKKIFGL